MAMKIPPHYSLWDLEITTRRHFATAHSVAVGYGYEANGNILGTSCILPMNTLKNPPLAYLANAKNHRAKTNVIKLGTPCASP